MRIRRTLFVLVTLSAGYAAVAGCSDDDAAPPSTTDAGSDVYSAPETAAPDTYVPPPTPEAGLDARSPELTGSACKAATDCYSELDASALKGGEAVCIDKVQDGYCTHKCQTDDDCCAVPGECKTGLKQVCSSFENTNDKFCFLSCEDKDIAAATDAGASDAGTGGDDYCTGNVSAYFGCRSTGGGAANRKVCLPVGAPGDGGAPKDGGGDADAGDGG